MMASPAALFGPVPVIAQLYEALGDAKTESDLAEVVRRADAELDEIEAEGFHETVVLFASCNGFDAAEVFRLVNA